MSTTSTITRSPMALLYRLSAMNGYSGPEDADGAIAEEQNDGQVPAQNVSCAPRSEVQNHDPGQHQQSEDGRIQRAALRDLQRQSPLPTPGCSHCDTGLDPLISIQTVGIHKRRRGAHTAAVAIEREQATRSRQNKRWLRSVTWGIDKEPVQVLERQ